MKNAIIYMEVRCDRCGKLIGKYYHNRDDVSRLKQITKSWKYSEECGNLCPSCLKSMELKRETRH